MENNNNNNLPAIPKKSFKEQLNSLLNKIMDFLFTNHSEGVVVAEFDEYGREIKKDENNESIEVETEFDSSVVKEERTVDENIDVDMTSDFEESLKVDLQTYSEKSLEDRRIEFVEELEEHPESLINLSMDRLKRIEEYYDELIQELDEKIEKCKKVS